MQLGYSVDAFYLSLYDGKINSFPAFQPKQLEVQLIPYKKVLMTRSSTHYLHMWMHVGSRSVQNVKMVLNLKKGCGLRWFQKIQWSQNKHIVSCHFCTHIYFCWIFMYSRTCSQWTQVLRDHGYHKQMTSQSTHLHTNLSGT